LVKIGRKYQIALSKHVARSEELGDNFFALKGKELLNFLLIFFFAGCLFGFVVTFWFEHRYNSVTHKCLTRHDLCNTVIGIGRLNPMANVLSKDKQIAIIGALAEGSSIRSIERLTGVHRDTIMRLHMRRLTRLMLAFSKKLENFEAAVALHFAYYNFVKRHNSIRCTPAMAAGVERDFWTVGNLVEAVI
jgi:hypothetical protein